MLAGDLTFELKSAQSSYGLRINFADKQDRLDTKVLDVAGGTMDTQFMIYSLDLNQHQIYVFQLNVTLLTKDMQLI